MGHVEIDEMGRMMANREMLENAPPAILECLNKTRQLHIEVATLNLVLIQRGLITIDEIQQARAQINHQIEEQFKSMIAQIQRAAAQAPTTPPPNKEL